MLHGNAKCSMTSLADTKHIFIERFMKPRISQLVKGPFVYYVPEGGGGFGGGGGGTIFENG